MVWSGQWGAVQPSGLGKKKRRSDLIRQQQAAGAATQQVVATKRREADEAQTSFENDMAQQSLANQQQQTRDAEKSAKRQERMGYANTGINLLDMIFSFFKF